MTLRKKTLLLISVTIIGLLFVLYFTLRFILLGNFEDIERQIVKTNIERTRNALNNTIKGLDNFTADYAGWDDTYQFVVDGNQQYIESNLIDSTFSKYNFNLLLVINNSGRLVYGKAFDMKSDREVPLSRELKNRNFSKDLLVQHKNINSSVKGIVRLSEGTMLVASRPILTSQYQGPIRGTLIMGRYLDSSEIEKLAATTHLAVAVKSFEEKNLPPDFLEAKKDLVESGGVFVKPTGQNVISGYMLWRDIYGNPALLIKIDRPRDIYNKGQLGMFYFFIALLLSGLVFALVTLFIVERVVLSKVGYLSRSIGVIEQKGDLSGRITVDGRDEMAGLAVRINRMMEALEQSSKEVYLSEEKLRRVTDSTLDLICEINESGEFIYNNFAYKDILGYSPEELIGDCIYKRIHPEDVNDVRAAMQKSLSIRSTGRMEFRHRHRGGHYLWLEVIGNHLFDQNGKYTGAILTMREVTERKLAEEQIRYQAYHDQLTGLPNRTLFHDRFSIALAQAKRSEQMLAVMFLDLDGFKLVNDTHGHDVGDFLLQAAASRLRGCVRAGDTVARLGGDEFTIILEGIQHARDASFVAKKIIDTLEQPFTLKGHELRVTTSIGISVYPYDGEDTESLIKNADSAMYEAKQRGKNQYHFHGFVSQDNTFV